MIVPEAPTTTRTGTGGWNESINASAPDCSTVVVVPTRSGAACVPRVQAVSAALTRMSASMRRVMVSLCVFPSGRIVAVGGSSAGRAPGLQPGGRGFESLPLHSRRFHLVSVLTALLIPAVILAQTQEPAIPLRIAASSQASVEVHLNARRIGNRWFEEDASLSGPSRIAISYGQPHARGRKVEGGLIPLDTVWRFGANMATTLHSDVDVTLGDLKVPRGDYSLFVLYTRTGYTLIVNRGTGQWGTDRDPPKDVGRVALASRTLAEPEPSLSIYLVPDSPDPTTGYAQLRGTLRIKWGTTELTTTWRVDQ